MCICRGGGNKRQAAKLLHLSRTTLIDKLQRLKAVLTELPTSELREDLAKAIDELEAMLDADFRVPQSPSLKA